LISSLCPLCGQSATFERPPDHDEYTVTCARCVQFRITGPLLRSFERSRANQNAGVIDLLSHLSELARATHQGGGTLNLTVDNWIDYGRAQRQKNPRRKA